MEVFGFHNKEIGYVGPPGYLPATYHVNCFGWFLERNISFPAAQLFLVAIGWSPRDHSVFLANGD